MNCLNALGVIFILIMALGSGPILAIPVEHPLTNPEQEARAVALGNELRCVVCQSESINESSADMARDLRQLVRDKIASGDSDRQIIDYIRARYGDFILLRPPFQANTWLLWLGPCIIFILAALIVVILLKNGKKEDK